MTFLGVQCGPVVLNISTLPHLLLRIPLRSTIDSQGFILLHVFISQDMLFTYLYGITTLICCTFTPILVFLLGL